MSLFSRLWLSLGLAFALLTLALGVGEYTTLQRALRNEIDLNLQDRAHWLAEEIRLGRMPQGSMVPLHHALEELGELFVEIRDPQGRLLGHSANLMDQQLPGGDLTGDDFCTVLSPEGHPLRVYQMTLAQPPVVVRVAESLQLEESSLRKSLLKLMALGLAGLLLAGALARVWLRRVLLPLTRVAASARQIVHSGDMSIRVEIDPQVPEVAQVATTLNALLARVGELLGAQARLLQDTSHELRNPLTVLQTDLDVLGRGDLDPEMRAEVAQEALGEVVRLKRLVQDLSTLSWAEARPNLQPEEVALEPFLRRLVERYQPLAGSRTLQLVPAPLSVQADRHRLEQILRNLLDNALRYTPEDGRITIWVLQEAPGQGGPPLPQTTQGWPQDRVRVVVQDTGKGIAREHWDSLFERFYRIEPDRNRRDGGMGLGLPLARALAKAMGGDLEVYSQPGQGSSFLVTLPRWNAGRPGDQEV